MCPRIRLLDCIILFLVFKEPLYFSPQQLYQFTFPPTVQKGSLFSTPSLVFVICRLFDYGHSDWSEVIPHCAFDLHFPKLAMLSTFACTFGHLCVFFGAGGLVTKLCLTLATPWTLCSLTGSCIHGIFQAKLLEWVVISFSRGFSQPRN